MVVITKSKDGIKLRYFVAVERREEARNMDDIYLKFIFLIRFFILLNDSGVIPR